MGPAGLGVAASVVGLPVGFVLIQLLAAAGRQADRCDEDVGRATDLFRRQQLAAEDVVGGRELLANAGTEQLAQNCHIQMAMNAAPTAAFEMIQTQFFLRFSKTVFNRPASKGDVQNLSQRPTVASRHTVRQKVFRFPRQHVASHDQRALAADQLVGVRLSPTSVPTNFPDLAAAMRVLDPITLSRLPAKRRRVLREVLDFAGLLVSFAEEPLGTFRAVASRFFQDFRLREPNVRVRRNLHDEGFSPLVQAVEKRSVTAVQFIRRPRHHLASVGFGPIDQIQGDLRFCREGHLVGKVVFFGARDRPPTPGEGTAERPTGD